MPVKFRHPLSDSLPRRAALFRLGGGLAAVVLLSACSPAAPDPLRVSLEEGRQLFESRQAMLIDIRETEEHATGVAEGARLLPMSQLRQRVGEIPQDPAQPVLIICATQSRSSSVVKTLKEAGWNNVRFVHGGMSDWAGKGWPMVRPPGLSPN